MKKIYGWQIDINGLKGFVADGEPVPSYAKLEAVRLYKDKNNKVHYVEKKSSLTE